MAEQKSNPTKERFHIDPVHEELAIHEGQGDTQIMTLDVWAAKYKWGEEEHPHESMRRVVEGVYAKDHNRQARRDAYEAMQKALWVPGGRIQAAAGTTKVVTMLNCFVDRTIEDSMDCISDALKDAMLTMQQGGGIGMDFSTLRPSGAYLHRTGAIASGPLPFMDMWDSMCQTIMSAGARRGAMMATMHCEHPDIVKFITAKHEKGRLTNFNVSVLITDAFMDAVENDEDWYLGFGVPRADGKHLFKTERDDEYHQGDWYAYARWQARELWDLIIQNTYEWSEPGVIFIDRVNDENNLQYCETIACTNPCGEQPLPPNGCCNLGAVNLARMVIDPFTTTAYLDYVLLAKVAALGVRFLDNVIDTAGYPLEEQKQEELDKRRIGIGITGLANALAQLQITYGGQDALRVTDTIMKTLKESVYRASSRLAKERGPFPLYDKERWGDTSVVKSLPAPLKRYIKINGIRNGVLGTIAPTGTTSMYVGNVSSGLEPTFLHTMQRRMRRIIQDADEVTETYVVSDYAYLMYQQLHPGSGAIPDYMVTHADVLVQDHLAMQQVCQKHIDASISKTINCPEGISFDEFKNVYDAAYRLGCKGCTTYRPSDVRGSVLSAPGEDEDDAALISRPLRDRPTVLTGTTYKVRWSGDENYYITINDDPRGRPFELFIQSTSSKYSDWTTALSLMISAIMRRGDDPSFIPDELRKVVSINDVGWIDGKFYGSLVSLIGETIGQHLNRDVDQAQSSGVPKGWFDPRMAEFVKKVVTPADSSDPQAVVEHHYISTITGEVQTMIGPPLGEICPECNMPTLHPAEGCKLCHNCGYSTC